MKNNNEIPIKKNEQYTVDILDNGYEGEGIAKIEGFTIFIPNAIKGEKCKIQILKITSSHAFGKILEIILQSEARKKEDCSTYNRCGGCSLRHIKYSETLKMKQNTVQNLIDKSLKNKIKVKETIGMKTPYHYRNKAQYPLGIDKNGELSIGIFAKRTHEIIPMEECKIQNPLAEKIAKSILEFIKQNKLSVYNEKTGKGLFRHIVVKTGIHTNEIMCILVVNGKQINKQEELIKMLNEKYKDIKTIIKNINTKNTNVIMGNENQVIYGEGYIYDTLEEYKFKISPMSFYQTNPIQTEVLYNTAIKLAELKKEDIVFDLYCGIGTIGIFASKYVKKVYGIEIVEDAIKDAIENAKINKVENIEFTCGDVEEIFGRQAKSTNVKPNVIFVDPPRRGLDDTTINNIIKLKPERLVYISCNPATMARDLAKLEEEYRVKEICPVDMFPFTSHVECVSVLQLK